MSDVTKPQSVYKYIPDRIEFFDAPCLRFSPIKDLNDPFESLISILEDDKILSAIERFLGEQLQTILSNVINEFLDIGVLSLSSNHKNLPMWAHYTNNHLGCVIELDSNNHFLSGLDQVTYLDNRLSFDGIEKFLELLLFLLYEKSFYKSVDWSYEEEWRIIKLSISKTEKINPDVIGLLELPIDSIKNIYLGLRTEAYFQESAMNFCKENKHIGLFKAKLHATRYEMDFTKIIV